MAAALAAAVALSVPGAAVQARAADEPPARRLTAPADSARRRPPKPFYVMLRSAAVPGLGQVTNHAWLKAAVVVAGEGYLGYRAWREWRAELDATDRASAMALLYNQTGDEGYRAASDRYLLDRDRHNNSKINFIWWAAAAHLLQMADAYVDAHFVDFDAEFGPDDRDAAGAQAGPRVTLAFRAHF